MIDQLRIEKVLSTESITLSPNTLYFVQETGSEVLNVYLSDKDGTSYKRIADEGYILRNHVTVSDTAPTLPCETQLWWNSAEGSLYIQYNDGVNENWVEAFTGPAIPEFAGNGEADTMARSDHFHYGIELTNNEW